MIACIANFSALPHLKYRIGLPRAGRWREVLNTDAAIYGGSGVGNLGGVDAVPEPYHGRPASAIITVPPMGVLWLTPRQAPEGARALGAGAPLDDVAPPPGGGAPRLAARRSRAVSSPGMMAPVM